MTRWGTLRVDHKTMMTSLDGVFAAGDIVRGASLVVWAIRDGRDVSEHMHEYLVAKKQKGSRHDHSSPERGGDRPEGGGGVPAVLTQLHRTGKSSARTLRKTMTLPEVLLGRNCANVLAGPSSQVIPVTPYTPGFRLSCGTGSELKSMAKSTIGATSLNGRGADRVLAEQGFLYAGEFSARDVLDNLEGCVTAIVTQCGARGPLHHAYGGPSSPFRGGIGRTMDRYPRTATTDRERIAA